MGRGDRVKWGSLDWLARARPGFEKGVVLVPFSRRPNGGRNDTDVTVDSAAIDCRIRSRNLSRLRWNLRERNRGSRLRRIRQPIRNLSYARRSAFSVLLMKSFASRRASIRLRATAIKPSTDPITTVARMTSMAAASASPASNEVTGTAKNAMVITAKAIVHRVRASLRQRPWPGGRSATPPPPRQNPPT